MHLCLSFLQEMKTVWAASVTHSDASDQPRTTTAVKVTSVTASLHFLNVSSLTAVMTFVIYDKPCKMLPKTVLAEYGIKLHNIKWPSDVVKCVLDGLCGRALSAKSQRLALLSWTMTLNNVNSSFPPELRFVCMCVREI